MWELLAVDLKAPRITPCPYSWGLLFISSRKCLMSWHGFSLSNFKVSILLATKWVLTNRAPFCWRIHHLVPTELISGQELALDSISPQIIDVLNPSPWARAARHLSPFLGIPCTYFPEILPFSEDSAGTQPLTPGTEEDSPPSSSHPPFPLAEQGGSSGYLALIYYHVLRELDAT